MDPLKLAIIEEVKNCKKKFADSTIESLYADFFLHESSLRLSYYGYNNIRDVFTPYPFSIDFVLKPRHLLGLAKAIKYPYFLSTTKLVLFSDSDALMIKLYGNVGTFLDNEFERTK
ncbi:MAG: hypothetical protein C5B52_08790 [Bacteroidetes bacterium]|nr:MAG: hypothetical protein C5B52_08790 [Bacteroidota bacterium]